MGETNIMNYLLTLVHANCLAITAHTTQKAGPDTLPTGGIFTQLACAPFYRQRVTTLSFKLWSCEQNTTNLRLSALVEDSMHIILKSFSWGFKKHHAILLLQDQQSNKQSELLP